MNRGAETPPPGGRRTELPLDPDGAGPDEARMSPAAAPPATPIPATAEGRGDFIVANTRLQRPPHTPEIRLHLADEITPIWKLTEEALQEIGLPPPFWAFAWAGGQALARYLIDNPGVVAGKRVIDFAAGSGLVGIAAMLAGAKDVLCADIDLYCEAAVALNAQANGVACAFTAADLLDTSRIAASSATVSICTVQARYDASGAMTSRAGRASSSRSTLSVPSRSNSRSSSPGSLALA